LNKLLGHPSYKDVGNFGSEWLKIDWIRLKIRFESSQMVENLRTRHLWIGGYSFRRLGGGNG